MRKASLCILGIVSCLAMVGAGTTAWSATVPVIDSAFSSGWSGGTPTSGGLDSGNYLAVGDSENAELTFTDNKTNVWVQVYAKPLVWQSELPTVATTDVSAAFCVTNGGTLYVANGADGGNVNWTRTTMTTIDTNVWTGFAVHLDCANDEYSLYVSTDGTEGTEFARVAAAVDGATAFTFPDTSVGDLNSFSVTNQASIDLVAAGNDWNPVTGSGGNLQVIAETLSSETAIAFPHGYGSGENTLDSVDGVAKDLLEWTESGDTIAFVEGVTYQFYNASDLSWGDSTGHGRSPVDQVVKQVGFWLGGYTGDFVAFSDYDVLFDGSGSTTIVGYNTGTTGAQGLNYFANTSGSTSGQASGGWGFVNGSSAGSGDKLFYQGSDGRFVSLWWNGSGWMDGPSSSSKTLEPNEPFFLKRTSSGIDGTWAGIP